MCPDLARRSGNHRITHYRIQGVAAATPYQTQSAIENRKSKIQKPSASGLLKSVSSGRASREAPDDVGVERALVARFTRIGALGPGIVRRQACPVSRQDRLREWTR